MTLAWAIIIVAVLFLLHKYHLLRKSLIAAAIIAVVLIVGVVGWIGWHYLDAQWEEHENKVRLAKENALFAQKNECLNLYTGKLRPVNKPDSKTEDEYNLPVPKGATTTPQVKGGDVVSLPKDAFEVGKTIPPTSGYTTGGEGWTPIPPGGLTQVADEHWCSSVEVIHERGTPIDQWLLRSEWPTIPTGDYVVTNGKRDADGNLMSPATACDQQGQHCYAMPDGVGYNAFIGRFGSDASTHLMEIGADSHDSRNLLLFTAASIHPNGTGGRVEGYKELALLANRGGQLSNLLPDGIIYFDPTEYRIWSMPSISPMPILVVITDNVRLLVFEAFANARLNPNINYRMAQINSYVYDAKVRSYVLLDSYTVENHDVDKALDREKAEILKRLKAAVDYAAPHTVTVQGAK